MSEFQSAYEDAVDVLAYLANPDLKVPRKIIDNQSRVARLLRDVAAAQRRHPTSVPAEETPADAMVDMWEFWEADLKADPQSGLSG